jgi:hypothetical protein
MVTSQVRARRLYGHNIAFRATLVQERNVDARLVALEIRHSVRDAGARAIFGEPS